MGGKRMSGRSSSGEAIHQRVASAGSTKSSPIDAEPMPIALPFYSRKDNLNIELDDDLNESPSPRRKNSFDIISLLETQEETISKSEDERYTHKESASPSEVPSFWHFVEPDHIFRHQIHHHNSHTSALSKEIMSSSNNHHKTDSNDVVWSTNRNSSDNMQMDKSGMTKRPLKRRKMKKVHSAKVGGFKVLERGSERLNRKGHEWLRVLTPPGTGTSSLGSGNTDSEDELIRKYFSGLSSAGSSISWAEDAMESEFTTQLVKLWEDIETVCAGGTRTENMSDAVYQECLQWRKAFPNPDLHRFSSFRRNDGQLSSVASPILEEDGRDVDVAFSSMGQSSSSYRQGYEESLSLMQAKFRDLNCSTPRPNIEKSTEYVNAWLSECQNSCVPDGDQSSPDRRSSRPLSPSLLPSLNSPYSEYETENREKKNRNGLRLLSGMEISRPPYTRSHAKFINESDHDNLFKSLTITRGETDSPLEGRISRNTDGSPDIQNLPCQLAHFSSTNNGINESDEEDEDGSNTPTEIVSFRPNVRVQRPISSRIRDHALTPIATGTYAQPSFAGRHHGTSLNKQITPSTSIQNSSENYRFGGKLRLFDSLNSSTIPPAARVDMGTSTYRAKSGLMRQGHSLSSQFGRSKQQPWSRHSGDDLAAEANYVSSLYENYSSSVGTRNIEEESGQDISDSTIPIERNHSPNSVKGPVFLYYDRPGGIESPIISTECEDQSFKSSSWLMNR